MMLVRMNFFLKYEQISHFLKIFVQFASILMRTNSKKTIGIKDFFWTAGTCLGNEPYFYWMGHTKPMTFTNWHRGEPNNNFPGNEDCFEMNHILNYTWADVPCSNKMFAVCEEKISKLNTNFLMLDKENQKNKENAWWNFVMQIVCGFFQVNCQAANRCMTLWARDWHSSEDFFF